MNSRVWILILFCIIGFFTGISLADIPSMVLENGHQSLITDFRADTVSGTAPVSVQFTDTSVGSPREWYWSFGDGSYDTVEHPLHLYTNPGIYSVSLRTTGTSGSDMKTRLGYITISEPSVTQNEIQANPITTSDQSSSRVISFPTPVDIPTSPDSTPLPSESPTQLTAVTPASTPALPEVSPIPTPSVSEEQSKLDLFNLFAHTVHANFTTSATAGLSPLVVQFTDNSSGNPDNWSWDFGDGTSSDLASPEHTYSDPGKYSVRLTVQGIDGSDTRVCDQLIEVTLPPEASIRAQPRNGSAPLVVAFTDTSVGRVNSWFWSFGDGTTSVEKNPVHTFTRAGVNDVSLTISGPDGGTNIVMPGIVTVTEMIQAPVAQISVDTDAGEAPLTVRFTDSSAGDVTTRTWDFGDSERGAASELTHTYLKPGIYTTVLNIKGPAGESRTEQVISVHEPVSPPKAAFMADTLTGTAPLVVSFTDSSTGNVSSWSWDFGDGTTSVEKNPVHTYTSAGSFSVRLTVSGSGGEDHLDKGVIVTEPLSAPTGSFTVEPAEGIAPLTVSFNDTSSGTISSWSWDFGDGSRSTDRNPTHTYPTSGYYQVVLLVEGSGGTGHAESSVVVKEPLSAPTGSFTFEPAEGVAPLDVSFTDTSSGTVSSWDWDFGDGARSADHNPTHTYLNAGSYQVRLTVKGPGGTGNAESLMVVKEPESAPSGSFTAEPAEGFSPLDVSFTDTSSGTISSWSWDFGDGTRSYEQNPVHSFGAAGSYQVVLSISGPGGQDSAQTNVVVTEPIAEPQVITTTTPEQTTVMKKSMVSRFTASHYDGASPLTVSFFDTSVGEITSWNWDFGDGTTSTEQNPSHTFTSAGNYPVSLTISGPEGERKSDLSMILVIASVTPPRALFTPDIDNGPAPLTVKFSDASTGEITTRTWDFGDGISSTELNPSHTYQEPGTYTVSLRVSGPAGESRRDARIVAETCNESLEESPLPQELQEPTEEVMLPAPSPDVSGERETLSSDNPENNEEVISEEDIFPVVTSPHPQKPEEPVVQSSPGITDEISGTQVMTDTTYGAAPLTVAFNSSSDCPVDTHEWLFGDGSSSGDPSPTHVYQQPGSYDVTLIQKDGNASGRVVLPAYITVTRPDNSPHASITASPTGGSAPLEVTFTPSVTGDASGYLWDFGDQLTSTERDPVHLYEKPGSYPVSLIVNGTSGETVATLSEPIMVSPSPDSPQATITAEVISGKAPLRTSFLANTSGMIDGYVWDFGDGGSSYEHNPLHVYANPGNYSVKLVVAGPAGTSEARLNETITVIEGLKTPVCGFTAVPASGFVPLNVSFTDTSTGSVSSYQWDLGDGTTSTEQNPVHRYTSPGVYTVGLQVFSPAGNAQEIKKEFINVEEQPAPPVARFKSDRRMGTAPMEVHFESLASGMVSSWNWDLGDGNISSEKDPVVTYTRPGVYTITQTVTGPGGKDVAVRRAYITVSAPVTPPIAVIYAEPVEGAAPLTVKFLDMSTGQVTGWHWDLGDGALSTNKNPTHIYQAEGTYTVKLQVSGPNGDSNTETTIRVSPHEQKIRKIGFIPDPEPVIQQKPVDQVSDDAAPVNVTDGTETPVPVLNVEPVASFSLSGRSGKSPLTITFHDRSSGDPTGWLWDFGDNVTSELKDPIHTYENPGVYSVNLTITSAGGSSQKLIREAVQVF